jgi:hypothetical protein
MWAKSDWEGLEDEDVATCSHCGIQEFGYACGECGDRRTRVSCSCDHHVTLKVSPTACKKT